MPRPSKRTRTKKRIQKPLPGGNKTTGYRGKAASSSNCSICGKPLTGVQNISPLKSRRLNRGRRRIWRLNGGQVCHECLKSGLKQAVRTT